MLELLTARGIATGIMRAANSLGRALPLAGSLLKTLNQLCTGLDVGWKSTIGPGIYLPHPAGIVIGEGVVIGSNCTIYSCVTIGGAGDGTDLYPTIGDNVYIGSGARILGGVEIGNDARIGANAVVIDDGPQGATAVGMPARIITSARRAENDTE